MQNVITESGNPLYLDLVTQSNNWSDESNMMFVVGATRLLEMSKIRLKAPNHFFLVPGVGAQGGDLSSVCDAGFNKNCGLLFFLISLIIFFDFE